MCTKSEARLRIKDIIDKSQMLVNITFSIISAIYFRQIIHFAPCFEATTQHISTVHLAHEDTSLEHTHTHTQQYTHAEQIGGGGRDAETSSRQPPAS